MSIHRTKSGTFRVKWREGGRQRSQTFVRKIDADKFEATLTLEDPFALTQCDTLKFSELVEIWVRDYAAVHKTASSRIRDESMFRTHILPFLGHKTLREISPQDIDRFQAHLVSKAGRQSPKTANNVLGLVRKVLKDAVRWRYLRSNPAESLRPIKTPEAGTAFWSFDELDRFLVFASRLDPRLRDLALLAAHTGLRKGEISGLQRDALDFENRRIVVKRSYCKHTRSVNEYTKGKRIRMVPMNDVVWKLLLPMRMLPPSQRLFPEDLDHVVRRMERVAKAADVQYIRFHDLRHTFASHLGMSGMSPFLLKELMGHSDMKITLRYTHLNPEQLHGATDALVPGKRKQGPKFDSEQANSLDMRAV